MRSPIDYYGLLFYEAASAVVILLNVPLLWSLFRKLKKSPEEKDLHCSIPVVANDLFTAVVYAWSATRRLWLWNEPEVLIPSSQCAKLPFTFLSSFNLLFDAAILVTYALDRFAAVSRPVKYSYLGKGYTVLIITVPMFGSILGVIAGALLSFESNHLVDSMCVTLNVNTPEFTVFLHAIRAILVFLSILVYIPILNRLHQLKNVSESTVRMLTHATHTAGYIIAVSFIFCLLPDIAALLDIGGIRTRLPIIYYVLVFWKHIFNFVIYAVRTIGSSRLQKGRPVKKVTLIHSVTHRREAARCATTVPL